MKTHLIISILLTGFTSAFAATIHVPGDQPTIQAGINAAVNGDTVLVAAGTYAGDGNRDIDFSGKLIVLRSESGAPATTIDCGGSFAEYHRGFFVHSSEDSSAVIDGFTITNAYDSAATVYVNGSGVRLSNCTITGNHSSGVRHIHGGSSTIGWLVVDHCTITGNSFDGVYANRIVAVRNSNLSSNAGYGLYLFDANPSSNVSFSVFAGNGLAGMGGSSFAGYMASVHNCTFVGNYDGLACVLDLPYGRAGSLQVNQVENCVMAFNRRYGYNCGGYVNPVVTCSDAYGNLYKDWNTSSGLPPGINLGNLAINPLFCDTSTGNYQLMNSSVCLAPNNGCSVQIGAFGVGCVCCVGDRGNVNLNGLVDLADLSALVNYLSAGGFQPLCPEEANIDGEGIVDLVDLSALTKYLTGGEFVLPLCPL